MLQAYFFNSGNLYPYYGTKRHLVIRHRFYPPGGYYEPFYRFCQIMLKNFFKWKLLMIRRLRFCGKKTLKNNCKKIWRERNSAYLCGPKTEGRVHRTEVLKGKFIENTEKTSSIVKKTMTLKRESLRERKFLWKQRNTSYRSKKFN